MRALFDVARQMLLRWTCVACGGPARQADLCEDCTASLPRLHTCCPRCAQPLTVAAPACGRCLLRPPLFDQAWAAWRYAEPLDRLIQRFKLGGKLATGRALAETCARLLGARGDLPQLLVPVPLHPLRHRQRGFDQALELARVLGRSLRIPVAAKALQRVLDTPTQTGLNRRQRRSNMRRAFALGELPAQLRHVALVDDVLTTGATANACARVLRKAGLQRVEVWALARAGR